ncbi:MAG: alpha/beta hydrolase [Halalkalicoccus sp.]|nr:alpha/beta hydrolase [Halalkalicoccus sp.]
MNVEGLNPQAEAMLDRRRRFGLTPLSKHGARRLRLFARVGNWFRNRNPPAVGSVADRTIPGPDGELPIRLYRPSDGNAVPTLVFFHGGGYVLGSLDSHDLLCRHLVRESGCAVLSVSYRLAPEHPFPAAVEDAYRATEWAAAHPAEVGGNGRLAVVGDSAGGTLAAVVALMTAERAGPDIDYQALLYPGIGIEEGQESVEEYAGLVLSKADLAWFEECYFESEIHRRNPYADPINAGDLSGVPPATVVTAGFDPLRDGGRAYAERLVSDGVGVCYSEYEDMIHGFATELGSPGLDRAHEVVREVAGDLGEAFGSA